MSELTLIKMHGCGNDYLFVDGFTQPVPDQPGELSVRLSHRHTGIGADGLVLMGPDPDRTADAVMRMFNADGSEGQLCGNALRCMAMWLSQTAKTDCEPRIRMGQRIIRCRVSPADPVLRTSDVEVDLGPPDRISDGAPTDSPSAFGQPMTLEDVVFHARPVSLYRVSIGNPHAVMFVNGVTEAEFRTLGPRMESHPVFRDRTNVEFATVVSVGEVRVRVWERGSGPTLACGSGACAVVVAGVAGGIFPPASRIAVRMDGGTLHVTFRADHSLLLDGPAAEVCRCTVQV